MAGGNAQRTGFVVAPGPRSEPVIKWEQPLGIIGESNTQPVLDRDGNLYVTAAPINRNRWTETAMVPEGAVVSLAPDGSERWRYTWTWDPNDPDFGGTWSQLSGPVITPDGRVVVGHRRGMFRCWNKDTGELLWERDLSPDNAPITSTPAVDKAGFVYVHCRDIPTVHKVDAQGRDVWVHRFVDGELGHTSSPTLSFDGATLYIGRVAGEVSYLYAIHTEDGTFKWAWSPEVSGDHSFAWSVPVADRHGIVYIQDEAYAHLYAVRDVGNRHALEWVYKKNGRDAPRLMAMDDTAIYSNFGTSPPTVFAINLDGTERWTRPLEESGEIGGMLVSPDALYFGLSGTGRVYALDPRNGDILWVKQVGRVEAGISEGITLSPKGVLYVPVSTSTSHDDVPSIVALAARSAKAEGFLNRWLVCGPFNNEGVKGIGEIHDPERELDFSAVYSGKNDLPASWRPNNAPVDSAFVWLSEEYKNVSDACAYALAWVRNDGPPKLLDFRLGSSGPLKLFLNDDVIWEQDATRVAAVDNDIVPVTLRPGISTIMLKVGQFGTNWGFFFRITEPGSKAIPEGITASDIPMSQTSPE